MEREQIIKALECCAYGGDATKTQVEVCLPCPYFNEGNCTDILKENALSLIKELTEVAERREGVEESPVDSSTPSVTELQRENERLRARVFEENHLRHQAEEMLANGMSVVKADAIEKFAERVKRYYLTLGGNTHSLLVSFHIDEIKKELLESEYES